MAHYVNNFLFLFRLSGERGDASFPLPLAKFSSSSSLTSKNFYRVRVIIDF